VVWLPHTSPFRAIPKHKLLATVVAVTLGGLEDFISNGVGDVTRPSSVEMAVVTVNARQVVAMRPSLGRPTTGGWAAHQDTERGSHEGRSEEAKERRKIE